MGDQFVGLVVIGAIIYGVIWIVHCFREDKVILKNFENVQRNHEEMYKNELWYRREYDSLSDEEKYDRLIRRPLAQH